MFNESSIPNQLYAQYAIMSLLKDRLKEAMEQASPKLSPADLSRTIGVSKATVSDWLSGKTNQMKGNYLLKAADVLGVSAKWLGSGKGPIKLTQVSETQAPYMTSVQNIEAMRRATRFLLDHVGIEVMEFKGADWTADTILKLYDLFRDPGAAELNEDTIKRLIS